MISLFLINKILKTFINLFIFFIGMKLLSGFFNMVESQGLWLLFILVFLEGNPFIGSFIPGQIIVIFIGFLISVSGIFNLYWTIFLVFLGALLGDIFGYLIGRRLGLKGLDFLNIKEDNKIYKSSRHFFKKYGILSIILGREFNLTRAFMPFLAGAFKMNYFKFLIVATFSCALWATLSVYIGYYFAFIIVDNFNFIMEFILFLVVYLTIVIFIYKNLNSYYKEKSELVYKHSIHNFILIFLLYLFVIFFLIIIKKDLIISFNQNFMFLNSLYFLYVLKFMFFKSFFLLSFFAMFAILFVHREFRVLIVYFWSFIFSFFLSFIISIFLSKWFSIIPFFSIILITIIMFYAWILMKLLIKNKKVKNYIQTFLIIILFSAILYKSIYSGNYFVTFLSFVIGAIETEIILLFSHYQIFDKCLSSIRFEK